MTCVTAESQLSTVCTILYPEPLGFFGQQLVARRESGVLVHVFYYHRISTVKQCKPLRDSQSTKCNNFFEFSRVSPGNQSLAKEPEDSGYEIAVCNKKFIGTQSHTQSPQAFCSAVGRQGLIDIFFS